jgi:tetratricopeptide (TPR) repeat protein
MLGRLGRERWRHVSPYLDRALELTGEQRPEWLATLRELDTTLADDVEDLLKEHQALDAEGFLDVRRPAPLTSSLAGQTVGAYRLRQLIGQGGMGTVWLADRCDGRYEGVAAVKLLNASLLGAEHEARFHREGNILARLRHPHIAHLIDAGISPMGQPFLVLEHVDGDRIDRYCEAHELPPEARVRLFLDVLAAVSHAHANLIVHRDLKPSNVLVTGDGRVKLLDFGIAKLLDAEGGETGRTALTREGHAALTPEYAAPEQLTGGHVTTATDVYALGVLLYVLLAGRHPSGSGAPSPAALVRSIVDDPPPRASEAAPTRRARRQLQGDLDNILACALNKRPEDRYPSVAALAEDLRRHLAHQPVAARPVSLGYRAAKFAQRHRAGLLAAALAAAVAAGLVGFYTTRLADERDRARREAAKAEKVSQLLVRLLTESDPYGRESSEPTVRAVLDGAARRIDTELAGEPELQADLLTLMGRVFQRLGDSRKAQPLLDRAVALGRARGIESAAMAQSLNDLGVLARAQADYVSATVLLQQALVMRRRVLGPQHQDVAVTLVELGRTLSDRGEVDRPERFFREALAIRRQALGDDHQETATSVSALALLLRHKGDLAGAESLFRENLERTRKARGSDHPNTATSLSNLALVIAERGDPATAEGLFREALASNRKTLGPDHPDVAAKLNNLAGALHQQRKYAEAQASAEEALRIARVRLGDDHPQVARYYVTLARIRLDLRDPRGAEAVLREALATQRRAYGDADWRTAATRSLLGQALTAQGRYAEAEPLLIEASTAIRDVPGLPGREYQPTRARLVALYEAWRKPEKAQTYR